MKSSLLRLLPISLLAVLLFVGAAHATPVIDFGDGGLIGGTVSLYSDGSLKGSNIAIGNVKISGAPFNGGDLISYTVTNGVLNFATGGLAGTNSITISGAVSALNVSAQTLLTGTISFFDGSLISQGLVSARGPDTKAADLLTAIGLSTNTPFQLFGFSVVTGSLSLPAQGQVSSAAAISTDIKNTAVPEPGSLLLLGSGLLGIACLGKRFRIGK